MIDTIFTLLIASILYTNSNYRDAYVSQNKELILNGFIYLDNKNNRTPDEICYHSSFLCLKANYSNNPYTKLSYFNQGYKALNALIQKHPLNVEYRFHRYKIEENAPAFLIVTNHTASDLIFIKKGLKQSNPIYQTILKQIKN